MPLRRRKPGGAPSPGGSISRLTGDIYGEAAHLAYYFHWSRTEIMAMSRRERRLWLNQLSRINGSITGDTNRFIQGMLASRGEEG
ncbi:MAG: DUF6760 family protein [Spirochaetaceae bacterium]